MGRIHPNMMFKKFSVFIGFESAEPLPSFEQHSP